MVSCELTTQKMESTKSNMVSLQTFQTSETNVIMKPTMKPITLL